ncbi:MAG: shikimate dehydrogenase [Candidatus Merdivicinus sp.]|jgi:shikimate dehydrogenase
MSWKLAVIGDPIGHTLSPLIQGSMMEKLGAEGDYIAHHVRLAELPDFVQYARENLDGFNITIPHKAAILPYLDAIDPYAQSCGAVNTVCIREGKLTGYNTDGDGIRSALRKMGADFSGNRVALLGAGGAAQSICRKALDCGAEGVRIFCRNQEKGRALGGGDCRAEVLPFGELCAENCGAWADIVLNATPLGMSGIGQDFADFSFLDGGMPFVCDIVYKPAETTLLWECRKRGISCKNGLDMLIYQAISAYQYFTGARFDADEMADYLREKVEAYLQK